MINTLDDFDVKGKIVLGRFDMNSPLDPVTGQPKDITRIKRSVETLQELSDKGARTVILIHQGGDLEYQNFGSTEPHAKILSQLLGKRVDFTDDVCGPTAREKIKQLRDGQILMLENVRYMAEELTLFETNLRLTAEEQAKTNIVRKLAPIADLYVCDAFAAAHRSQPTLVGMEEVLPSAMGRLFEREMAALERITQNPQRPSLFVLGGAKIQDAFLIISAVLEKRIADTILATGLVSIVLSMAKGINLGEPSFEIIKQRNLLQYIDKSKKLLNKYQDRILLPIDFAYIAEGKRQDVKLSKLPIDYPVMDIGTETANKYAQIIVNAKTIFFNGPPGVFEEPQTEYGPKCILNAIAECEGFSVLGGGDSIAAVNKYNLADKISYISTGGGALIRYIGGEELPVIKALKKATIRFEPRINRKT